MGPERTFNDVLCRSYGVVATILCLFVTVIMAILVAALSIFNNGHYATPMIRLWAWSLFRICGVRGEIEGLDNLEGLETFVLVSNHKSVFDIVAVPAVLTILAIVLGLVRRRQRARTRA